MRESTALLPASESALFMITRNLVLKAFNRSIRDYRSVRHARFSTSSIFCLFFLTRQVLILSLFKMISTRTNHNLVSGEEDGKKKKRWKKSHIVCVTALSYGELGSKFPLVRRSTTSNTASGPVKCSLPLVQQTSKCNKKCRLPFLSPCPSNKNIFRSAVHTPEYFKEWRAVAVENDQIQHTTEAMRTQKKHLSQNSPHLSLVCLRKVPICL